jgi:predicted cobalt transporter CbtA
MNDAARPDRAGRAVIWWCAAVAATAIVIVVMVRLVLIGISLYDSVENLGACTPGSSSCPPDPTPAATREITVGPSLGG